MTQHATPNIKVIFFDAGGTLFRPFPSVGAVYARVAAKHGVTVDAEHVETLFRAKWHERNGMTTLAGLTSEKIERDWWYKLVTEIFTESAKGSDPNLKRSPSVGTDQIFALSQETLQIAALGQTPFRDFDAFFYELYDRFAHAECWRLFDDTVPVLQKLKRDGFRLAIISNWDHRLFSIVEQLGLSSYFELVVASSVVGVAKPGRRIFEAALGGMKVEGRHAMHVGDSVEDDYHGASRAGLKALLIDRHRKPYNDVVRIDSLLELPNHIT